MNATALDQDIAQLESGLEKPSTPDLEARASRVASRLLAIGASEDPALRALAVRGLLAANTQIYRTGQVARSGELLRVAVALSQGLDADVRITALLRCAELELLVFDIGAALGHIATALEIARATGRRMDEARAWVHYGTALDSAGLYREADQHWTHALQLLEGTNEARLRGNIWALRCPLGFRLQAGAEEAAEETCRQALAFAFQAPAQQRDSMACTARCNWAALEIQRGRVAQARIHLAQAEAFSNLGVRPRWLIEVLRAMALVRESNSPESRAALDAMLEPQRAPAAVYVIETLAVMAATFASMGDGEHAGDALRRLSMERARALWAMLRSERTAGAERGEGEDANALLLRLAVTAELRDDATGRHCYRVGRMAMLLADRAGQPPESVAAIELAARLHDIGKLVIPDAILLKPGHLDATEMHLMRSHAPIGAEILSSGELPVLEAARDIARHHHERWDGSGYPDGLAGEAIPLAARISSLADVYDALTHERPYKRAWPHDEAMAYIRQMRGIQFDPRLTDHFVAMMDEARSDLVAFLRDAERGAASSPYVLAQASVTRTLEAARQSG